MVETPAYCDPERIGTLFYPDTGAIAAEAESAGLAPAVQDDVKRLLLLIDMQVDFCHENGALHVPGAKDDIRRVIDFIFRHAERITHITCSLDSHYPFQIFHPAWWVGKNGRHPEPFTVITAEEVEKGTWRALRDPEWSLEYVEQLQEHAKKQLLVWPYHVPIGGMGNALDPELWSAVFWHAIARKSQPTWWTKGSIPQTEHYSILQPEVEVHDHPHGGLSREFLEALQDYDQIFIAGEAESHCVLETVEDMVELFGEQQLRKLFILRDCTSPVVHPDIDFHAIAMKAFAKYEEQGVQFVESMDSGLMD